MNRNLTLGLVFAIALHAVVGIWGKDLVRPVRAAVVRPDEPLVRTVREQIQLPKPPPPPEPKVEPKPEPKPEPAPPKAPTPQAQPKPASSKPRPPQPKSQPKPASPPPPASSPPPALFSQTYGSGNDPGVAVQKGEEDVFGDPDVAANDENRRRRREEPREAPQPTGDATGTGEGGREIEIVHAVPKGRCQVDWPEGADAGHRVVEVRLSLEVSVDGTVTKARIVRGAGEPFDAAAVAAVKACAFRPGTRDGKPFADRVPFAVEFRPGNR